MYLRRRFDEFNKKSLFFFLHQKALLMPEYLIENCIFYKNYLFDINKIQIIDIKIFFT